MKWFRRWVHSFDAESMNDFDVQAIAVALNNPAVRGRWMQSVFQELRDLNLSVDKILDKRDFSKLLEISVKRAQTIAILQLIETAKNSVELDSGHNPDLHLDSVAVAQAPGR